MAFLSRWIKVRQLMCAGLHRSVRKMGKATTRPISNLLIGFVFTVFVACAPMSDEAMSIQGSPIADQIFIFDDAILGRSTFIPTIDDSLSQAERLKVYVRPHEGALLQLPPPNTGFGFEKMVAVAFRDVNKDGMQDIVIIGSYIAGIGERGTEPFDMPLIYLRKGSGYQFDSSTSEQIALKANGKLTIDQVVILFHAVVK